MFYSTLLAAAAFTAAVSAQNYSTSGSNLTIVPDSVDLVERQAWCRAQQNTCPVICGGQATPNTCDPTTLIFGCTCTNGNTPNITDYQQTIPGYVCRQWVEDCVNAHPNDLQGITNCRSITCGNKTVDEVSDSSSSSAPASSTGSSGSGGGMASMTSSSMPSSTGSDSDSGSSSQTASSTAASASASGDSGAAALMSSNYGTGILAAGILAAFGLAL